MWWNNPTCRFLDSCFHLFNVVFEIDLYSTCSFSLCFFCHKIFHFLHRMQTFINCWCVCMVLSTRKDTLVNILMHTSASRCTRFPLGHRVMGQSCISSFDQVILIYSPDWMEQFILLPVMYWNSKYTIFSPSIGFAIVFSCLSCECTRSGDHNSLKLWHCTEVAHPRISHIERSICTCRGYQWGAPYLNHTHLWKMTVSMLSISAWHTVHSHDTLMLAMKGMFTPNK